MKMENLWKSSTISPEVQFLITPLSTPSGRISYTPPPPNRWTQNK